MNARRLELENDRDQALRDLLELDRQAAEGELEPAVEARLRRGYQREAAAAIAALEHAERKEPELATVPARSRRGLRQPRVLLYALGLIAVVAAGVLLPGYVLDRPQGGFVSGNEPLQSQGAPTAAPGAPEVTGRNLANVTDKEMEAVVQANPDVLGMRLALANRYMEKGRYDLAAAHYRKMLEQDPANAEAKAHIGWLMLKVGKPDRAAQLVDDALAADPSLVDALWFKANVRLYGFNDATGAIKVLDQMSSRADVSAEVRTQITQLRALASRKSEG
ncbi:hypothetical protein BKD30_10645 [Tersicoccus phoenicis]|uniref:Uncharacterized protein n=1 Tax=Tersicoccus phoenicis TaxID=554083 RepID=A0A1R1L8G6_9MICC|nr:tetratricopeptide repeat protein [Tersicoccus phoenicis]OMH23826.1 hypothetical protein BKD30_10645 [Tersicoccus phoenicis]